MSKYLTDDGKFIARSIREARELQIIQGPDFARFMADRFKLIGPAKERFLNISNPNLEQAIGGQEIA